MFDPFTNCFTFLLHHNPITGPRRRRRTTRAWFRDDEDEAISGVSSQFRQVFKLIDANGDGKISASELGDIIVCLGSSPNSKKTDKGLAVKEAEGIVRVLDFNGDGFVDMDEFMMVVKKEEKEEEDDDEDDEEREELKDAFLIYDSDRNGLISAKELRRVMVNLGWTDCSIRDCKNMIRAVDLNGDGFVDFHEFRAMMRSNSSRRQLPNH
ncbi:hypothetical protein K1719_038076 [Acacia pycnantha]|nr:hypothetical protein K1719_038076 [Acacia pycnantha]